VHFQPPLSNKVKERTPLRNASLIDEVVGNAGFGIIEVGFFFLKSVHGPETNGSYLTSSSLLVFYLLLLLLFLLLFLGAAAPPVCLSVCVRMANFGFDDLDDLLDGLNDQLAGLDSV